VKYSVKTQSRALLLLPIAAIVAAYFLPLQNWMQIALLGVATGITAGFAGRSGVVRTFEPADAPIASKRKIVVGFALARLVFGLLLILLSAVAFADWLAPAFLILGGYLIGTTAATPISDADIMDTDQSQGGM